MLVVFSSPLSHEVPKLNQKAEELAVPPLNQKADMDGLVKSFEEAGRAVHLKAIFANTDSLRSSLTAQLPTVLHFSGHVRASALRLRHHSATMLSSSRLHCSRVALHQAATCSCTCATRAQGLKDCLMFEHKNGLGHRLDVDGLRRLVFAGQATSLRLVFVAACHSEAAAIAFRAAGVPCVVAVRLEEQLHDGAAITFTQQFYTAIASGNTVRQAFDIGKEAVANAPELKHQVSHSAA